MSYHLHMMNGFSKLAFLVFFSVMTMTVGARADQIDGQWCSREGRSISIDGSQVVTPGGQSVTANYDRHHVDFEIPKGEEHAGALFSADQLNDDEIRVTIIGGTTSQTGTTEIWKSCKPTV